MNDWIVFDHEFCWSCGTARRKQSGVLCEPCSDKRRGARFRRGAWYRARNDSMQKTTWVLP